MVNLLLLVVYSITCCSGIYIDMLPVCTTLTPLLDTGRIRILFHIFHKIGLIVTEAVSEQA